MRSHELSKALLQNTCPCRVSKPDEPPNPGIRLFLRFMPAVYRLLDLNLHIDEPSAHITLKRASVCFPNPYDGEGSITEDFRHWLIEVIRNEAQRLGLNICLVFPAADAIYYRSDGTILTSNLTPEGGLIV